MAGSNHGRRHPSYYSKRRRRRRHHPYKRKGSLAQQKQQQQDWKKQEESSGQFNMESSEFDDDDIHVPVLVPMLDIGITSWLPLPELSGAWRWCSHRVTQSLNWVKDTIFPSRVYCRELKETKEQLLHLHQQIEQLKSQTINKVENQHAELTCACKCQNLAITERPHLTQQPAIDLTPVQEGTRSGTNMPPAVSAAPPPPPPPPPPPIAQPPKLLVFKKKTSKSSDSANVTKQPPIITLSDIMNVKLKKVSCHVDADKQDPTDPVESRAMTNIMNVQLKKTFKDKQAGGSSNEGFKAVRLKRRKSVNQRNDENSNPMVLRSRISEEAVQFRGNLRKVRGIRSPGRTPLRSKSRESHGTGLTPLMTTALRRKFKTVRTPSPTTLAISSSTSPLFNF